MTGKGVHNLIIRICEYVSLYGKRLRNVSKPKILRWKDLCGLATEPNVITKTLLRGRQNCQCQIHDDGRRGQREREICRCYIAGFKDGRGLKPRSLKKKY